MSPDSQSLLPYQPPASSSQSIQPFQPSVMMSSSQNLQRADTDLSQQEREREREKEREREEQERLAREAEEEEEEKRRKRSKPQVVWLLTSLGDELLSMAKKLAGELGVTIVSFMNEGGEKEGDKGFWCIL